MANGQKKKGQSKPNVKADATDATKPASENLPNGDLRTAIVEIIMNEEEEEGERLLWQINNNTMLYIISFATETPIKTCNMSLAWEPPL